MNERPLIAVYIMASRYNGTLYVGVTSNLYQRAHEHREGIISGFTRDYGCKLLVWYEPHENMSAAIGREKAIKHYVRDWKINLIERDNPGWLDLSPGLVGEGPLDLRKFNAIAAAAIKNPNP